jgi:protein-S-isoprenylcysteine O-methyltransferase Ste14
VLQLIPALCWLIFLTYWIASARGTKTTIERQRRSREVVMRLPLLAGGYLIGSGGRAIGLATPIVRAGIPALQIAGCVFCTLGLAFTLWARRTLARNWSSSVTFKENHELIQGGPYAYVRHPIYTGLLLMLFGTALVMNHKGALVGVAMIFGGFWWKLRQEEALMTEHFPGTYTAYQRRVKALIPGVL